MANEATNSTPRPESLVLTAGAVVGLCIMGDSLLYAVLPLEAANLGIALPLVGVLLSANRIVRLFANTPVGMLFERWGVRWPFVGATILGLIVALLYGTGWGFMVFLVARIGWGLAWSGLRLGGFQAVWAGPKPVRGRLMGLLGAVISIGAATSVLLGGYLRDQFGFNVAVYAMAVMVALSIPLALNIRWPSHLRVSERSERQPLDAWLRTLRTPQRASVLLATFLNIASIAILVSTAALFLQSRLDSGQVAAWGIGFGTITGMLLAVRWLSDLFMGPLLGEMSDRLGQGRLALSLSVLSLVALVGAVTTTGLLSFLFLAFVFLAGSGITVSLGAAATSAAAASTRPQLFLGAYATAFDAGLALGPILGLTLAGAGALTALYLLGGVASLAAVSAFWWVGRQQPVG
jgi:predicted MFS family arabinose efflux permease